MRRNKTKVTMDTVITTSANGLMYPFGIGAILAQPMTMGSAANFKAGDHVRVTVEKLSPGKKK